MSISSPSLKFIAFLCLFISPFCLSSQHLSVDLEHPDAWRGEFFLGKRLSQQHDFSLAIESFKRAQALCCTEQVEPRRLIDQQLIDIYFNLGDYRKVIETFALSPLSLLNEIESSVSSLWIKVYKSYEKLGQHQSADELLKKLSKQPGLSLEPLLLTQAFSHREWSSLENWIQEHPKFSFLREGLQSYKSALKSKRAAKWLSLCIPGAGYYYAGRRKSGVTSFLINGLLIAASTQCFMSQLYTLGILTSTFELGWYFGGVFGATKAVQQHNDQLLDQLQLGLEKLDFSNQENKDLDETLD